jgi:hypothetical protein
MNPSFPPLEKLQLRDRELKAQIAQLGEMRPGSLVQCYRKCGKPNGHCARAAGRGHGPLWMVTHAVEGKTVSRAVPFGPGLERTRTQIAEYQRFRKLARALVATNEQICNARLQESSEASSPEVKKNGVGRGVRGRGGARA